MEKSNTPPLHHSTDKRMLIDIQSRLAVVEHQGENSSKERARMYKELEHLDNKLGKVEENVNTLVQKFATIEGKVGGVIWVITALFTSIAMFGDKIWNFLQKTLG